MEEDYLKKLVKRYLDKKSTDNELEIFVSLMADGKLDKYIQEAMDHDIEPELQEKSATQRKSIFVRLRWPATAASIALMLGLYHYNPFHRSNSIAKVNIIKILNHTRNISKQVLPDGSMVWLNPNTLLSYPSKFGKLREVKMEGEAFFEVTKDHSHPFQITSGKILTTVWGTSFRIRSIPGDNSAKVSVLTGKVSVSVPEKGRLKTYKITEHEEVMLLPQQEVTYQQSVHRLVKATIPVVSDMQIWHKANLSFENIPLATIAADLSSYYHVKIAVEGEKLGQYQITADFTDKNLADILMLISKTVHTDYTRNNNKITLGTTTLNKLYNLTNQNYMKR